MSGKVAIVTGGAKGIGLGIAKALTGAGCKVVIVGRTASTLQKACDELGENAVSRVFDLNHRSRIPEFVDEITKTFGKIDILVNNAGIHLKKDMVDTTDEEIDSIINTNLLGVFSLTRECINKMIPHRSGVVLLISSMAALFGIEKVVAYGTSKTALTGLMQNTMAEVSRYNIRINTIAPGWIETDMFRNAIEHDAHRKAKIIQRIALPGFGTPEDIGNAALFLCSDASRYITGIVMAVDGGAAVNF